MQLEHISLHESPEERLRATGHRVTPQRVLLLRLLAEADQHLDADTLYERANAEDASISLATVYRTLAVFKELGLVEQRYFARDHGKEYYEPSQRSEHYHFTCLNCGRVIEFTTPLVNQIGQVVADRYGAQISHTCVCFEGLCAACRG